jgi:hypothetical protein
MSFTSRSHFSHVLKHRFFAKDTHQSLSHIFSTVDPCGLMISQTFLTSERCFETCLPGKVSCLSTTRTSDNCGYEDPTSIQAISGTMFLTGLFSSISRRHSDQCLLHLLRARHLKMILHEVILQLQAKGEMFIKVRL